MAVHVQRTPVVVALDKGDLVSAEKLLRSGGKVPDKYIRALFSSNERSAISVIYQYTKSQETKDYIIEIQQHREGVDASAIDRESAKKAVEAMLFKKAVRPVTDFERKGEKTAGITDGYVAEDTVEKKAHMVKKAKKNPSQVKKKNRIGQLAAVEVNDQRDLIIEYLAAPIAKRILMDAAPDIGLVTGGDELKRDGGLETKAIHADKDASYVALRSTFFENFQTLDEFTSSDTPTQMGAGDMSKVRGLERVIVCAILMGEFDYHAGNIGVIEKVDENGEVYYQAVKIDHGKSLVSHQSFSNMQGLMGFFYKLKRYNYYKHIDRTALQEALQEMSNISEDEVRAMMSKQMHDLVDAGLDVAVVAAHYGLSGFDPEIIVNDLTKNVMANVDLAKGMAKELEKINQKAEKEKAEHTQKFEGNKSSYESSEATVEKTRPGAALSEKEIKALQKEWGESKTGIIAQITGKVNKPFKLDQKSDGAKALMNIMSKVVRSNPELAGKAEALILGIQKGKLATKGVQAGLEELISETNLSDEVEAKIIKDVAIILKVQVRKRPYKLDPKSDGMHAFTNCRSKILDKNPKLDWEFMQLKDHIESGSFKKSIIADELQEVIEESGLSTKEKISMTKELNDKMGLSMEVPKANHAEEVAAKSSASERSK